MTHNLRQIPPLLSSASVLAMVLLCLPSRVNAQPSTETATSRAVPIELERVVWSVPITGRSISVSTCDRFFVLQDDNGIRALNLQTGHPEWPLAGDDAGWLIEASKSKTKSDAHLNLSGGEFSNRCERWTGLVPGQVLGTTLVPFHLVALDLTSQGRVEWVTTAEELTNQSGWNFCSQAVLHQGGTVVLLSHPKHGVVAVKVNETGKRDWSHRFTHLTVDDFRQAVPVTAQNKRVQVRSSGDSLFVVTRTKVIELVTATEAGTERLFEQLAGDTLTTDGPLECLVTGGQVHRLSGEHWSSWNRQTTQLTVYRRISERVDHIPGALSGIVVLAGKDCLAVNAITGETVWRLTSASPAMQGAGTSVLEGQSLLWPKIQEIWQINASTGEQIRKVPLKAIFEVEGGNLKQHENMLFIESSERLWSLELKL